MSFITTLRKIAALHLRKWAGALLRAAQRIDPLPSTTPTPALAPDRLT